MVKLRKLEPADLDAVHALVSRMDAVRHMLLPYARARKAKNCLPENPASARVLEKLGMRKEGFLVGNLKIHGVWKSSFLYAMLAEEWNGGRKGCEKIEPQMNTDKRG